MKIMLLTPSFERSSPVQGAFVFAKYLHQQGDEVTFAALDSTGRAKPSLLLEIERSGLPFQCFDMTGWPGLKDISRVRTYVEDHGIETVLCYSLRPEIVVSRLSGVIRVSAVREILRDQFFLSYGRILASLLTQIRLRVLKRLDAIFVLTRAMGEHLTANGIALGAIHHVNNFVDVEEIRGALGNGASPVSSSVHIGYFGLLNRRKRVDVALRAVAKLVRVHARQNVSLHIAGDGPLRPWLMGLAQELGLEHYAVFHGYLRDPFELMRKMNLVILTSEGEGLPRCLLEAMALGKTCIASDIPGMSEFIKHGETGYLFRKADFEELASLMNDIIGSKRYLPPEVLYRYMLDCYDVDVCAAKMRQTMQRILQKKSLRA